VERAVTHQNVDGAGFLCHLLSTFDAAACFLGFSSIMGRCLSGFGGGAPVASCRSIIGHAIRGLRGTIVRARRRCVCLGSTVK
jgi:hypothetical protein